MRRVGVNIARLVLAVTLIFSGFVKAVDPMGTQYKIEDYLEAARLAEYVPELSAMIVSVLLSAFEFLLGICLLFAIRRRLISRLATGLMLVMTLLTLWLAIANPISDCGCFGDAIVLTNWQTFLKNVMLLVAAAVVARYPLDMMRFISRSNQWIVINYTIVFIFLTSGLSLYNLPLFDFRPYHIGTDLRTNWQKTMEGADLPYADLFIEEAESGEDITQQVLERKGYTFLLIAPHLEEANDSHLDQINEIYEYAKDHDYPFYCLTASGEKGITMWEDRTGAEYTFCHTDDITLKTIIRSNPGLVLLRNGVIIRKWSHQTLPDEEALTLPLGQSELGQLPEDSIPGKIARIFLWFILPLLALTIADRYWAWTQWVRRKGEKEERREGGKERRSKGEKEN